MAKEITTNLSVSVGKGKSASSGQANTTEDADGGFAGFRQTIGITAESIDLGADVATPKVVFIQNLSVTDFVEIDKASTIDVWPQKLLPGAAVLLRPSAGASFFAKADTNPVPIWIVAG
jgi:hypothetical protein